MILIIIRLIRLNPCSNGRYSLTLTVIVSSAIEPSGLNPCSNGRYSLTVVVMKVYKVTNSLNPCSNGRYSLT